jgi:hypothetical protein
MLWYKGWLETRLRILFVVGFMVFFLTMQHSAAGSALTASAARRLVTTFVTTTNPTLVMMACGILAGAGIATQPSFTMTKGLHGSTLFTLSLPVSRLRLLAVRASLGWMETAVVIGSFCCAWWFLSPPVRTMATGQEMFEYGYTVLACASMVYFLSVLLATFLDDQWRVWGTMLGCGALAWLSYRVSLPASMDIFRAMGKGSPLLAHAVPWSAMAFAVGLAAVLFFAALKIVQTREY